MKKFAVVSQSLPPSQSGQSVVLYHLLRTIPPENYCLITQKNYYLYHYLQHCMPRLQARYYHLSPDYQIIRQTMKALSGFSIRPLLVLVLKNRVRQIKKILIKEKAEVVVTCTADLFDPPAAILAGKELGIPVILYTFDFYAHQWTDPLTKSFAHDYEELIHKEAARIIVPNEGIAQEYFHRYGIRPVVIHNPFDLAEYEQDAARSDIGKDEPGMSRGGIRIVYTGAVYDAHYSAFRNLLAAMPRTGIPDLTLHIYTPQSPKQIRSFGITGPVVIHKARPNNEIPSIQRNADILFLPLAFNSPYPDIIRTSAPGKTGEYLAAGKPVLVHAPNDSFISWFFEKYHCGDVASEDDPDILAERICRLVRDEEYRRELVENAYRVARDQFDAAPQRHKFIALINGDPVPEDTTESSRSGSAERHAVSV